METDRPTAFCCLPLTLTLLTVRRSMSSWTTAGLICCHIQPATARPSSFKLQGSRYVTLLEDPQVVVYTGEVRDGDFWKGQRVASLGR